MFAVTASHLNSQSVNPGSSQGEELKETGFMVKYINIRSWRHHCDSRMDTFWRLQRKWTQVFIVWPISLRISFTSQRVSIPTMMRLSSDQRTYTGMRRWERALSHKTGFLWKHSRRRGSFSLDFLTTCTIIDVLCQPDHLVFLFFLSIPPV